MIPGGTQRGMPFCTRGTFHPHLGPPGPDRVTVRPGDPIMPGDAFVLASGGVHDGMRGVQGEVPKDGMLTGAYLVYVGTQLDAPSGWRYVPLQAHPSDTATTGHAVVA